MLSRLPPAYIGRPMWEPSASAAVAPRISDNGLGIDEDHISHVFEPFVTTERIGEGTGLGKWISYGIVREDDGEPLAANEPEAGATFSFVLPAV